LAYYVREAQSLHQSTLEVWEVTEDEAIRLGTDRGGLWHYRREPSETIWEAIDRLAAWQRPDGSLPIHELKIAPGQFHPRIARSIIPGPPSFTKSRGWQPTWAGNENAIASAKVQLSTLVRQLERICETIHPSGRNLEAYGHDIRNVLILACAEVESHWRAVLKANGARKGRWTTRNYVELADAMKFNEFAVSFPDYPRIEPIAPFTNWDKHKPTETLPWYDAYNAAKHDRESEFERATLQFAFEAVAACAVMIVAQFGEVFGFDLRESGRPRTFFWMRKGPDWKLADNYVEPYESGNGEWTSVKYPFAV
jgi:hypothetical protein